MEPSHSLYAREQKERSQGVGILLCARKTHTPQQSKTSSYSAIDIKDVAPSNGTELGTKRFRFQILYCKRPLGPMLGEQFPKVFPQYGLCFESISCIHSWASVTTP